MEPVPEFEQPIGLNDLRVLELSYETSIKSKAGESNVLKTMFDYGCGLVKSDYREDCQKGVLLLKNMVDNQNVPNKDECLYHLALGNYRLSELMVAKKCVEKLLVSGPENNKAQTLKRAIEQKLTRDGVAGMAIAGGILAVLAGAFYLFKRK